MADLTGTIAAEATPPSRGALRVVRLSGPDAFSVIDRIFKAADGSSPSLTPRRMVLGNVLNLEGRVIDEALAVCFKAPASLTGEDVSEIHLHGGEGIVEGVLSALKELGIRGAMPGEFTYRAVTNGKMSLIKAEAVQALVDAQTASQAALLAGGVTGVLDKRISALRDTLLDLRVVWEASTDFPEDIPSSGPLDTTGLDSLIDGLAVLVENTRSLSLNLRHWRFTLAGPVNSGKSSLFNSLLGRERMIVSDTPGTTRDDVEEPLEIDSGVSVVLRDTAGIRFAEDSIELEGVVRSIRANQESDATIFVYDLSESWGDREEKAMNDLPKPPVVFVANKIDLCASATETRSGAIKVSAKTGEGIDRLKDFISGWVREKAPSDGPAFFSRRQEACCSAALAACTAAKTAIEQGFTEEIALQGIKEAQQAMDELLGGGGTEDLYDRIFASFCLGK